MPQSLNIPLSANVLIQLFATLSQFLNLMVPIVSPSSQKYVALGIGFIQALTAFVAHYSTPPDQSPKATLAAEKVQAKEVIKAVDNESKSN